MPHEELEKARQELAACRRKVLDLQKRAGGETVDDYVFKDGAGREVRLSELFGDKDDLIVVHNMGKSCPYCTLWADGFAGVVPHLENRAGFAVVSPDPPEVMAEFAGGRGWNFRILSNDGGRFTADMGYENGQGGPMPGISTFHRGGEGQIRRIAHAPFGPGDEFCATWHIFDMLKAGSDGWTPQFAY